MGVIFYERLKTSILSTIFDFNNVLSQKGKIRKITIILLMLFQCKSHFENDRTRNYLVFQPVYRYFENISKVHHISGYKSKGLPHEIIKHCAISNHIFPDPHSGVYVPDRTKL